MGFLPKTMGTRPRLACEMRAEGVVAARAEDSAAALSAVERVVFADGAMNGRVASRAERVAAMRRALDAVSGRVREVTLVVPDTAARVLLVDFDELPGKASEALPVVRFRLKKLLPFDADDAAVSYQVMAQTRGGTQVLAVAMPRESLNEYESIVRDAGYEPGAVLPSTLAALAGLDEDAAPSLVVNAGREAVTTAIVKDGVLLLHRTIDLTTGDLSGGGVATAVMPNTNAAMPNASAGEAAARVASPGLTPASETSQETTIAAIAARLAAMEARTPVLPRAPDAAPVSRMGSALASGMATQSSLAAGVVSAAAVRTAHASAEEIAQAVSVAAAYFEDTLEMAPQRILAAGTLGADALAKMLGDAPTITSAALRVEEMASVGASGAVPEGWLAGVRGALRS